MSHRYVSFPVRAGPLKVPVLQSRDTCAIPCGLLCGWGQRKPATLCRLVSALVQKRQKPLRLCRPWVQHGPFPGNGRISRALQVFPRLHPMATTLCITINGRSRRLVRGPGANGAMVGRLYRKAPSLRQEGFPLHRASGLCLLGWCHRPDPPIAIRAATTRDHLAADQRGITLRLNAFSQSRGQGADL